MKRRDYLKTCLTLVTSLLCLNKQEKAFSDITKVTASINPELPNHYYNGPITAVMVQCEKRLHLSDLYKRAYVGNEGRITTQDNNRVPIGTIIAYSENMNPCVCMVHLNES